jgi:hypothetical protein
VGKASGPPKWIKPQLTRLVDEAPAGTDWLHEIKYDGYRMHARLDHGKVQLLTRTGLDWSNRYLFTLSAIRSLPVKTAYIDGELCALLPDGVPSFGLLQAAMDQARTNSLVFIAFTRMRCGSPTSPMWRPGRGFVYIALCHRCIRAANRWLARVTNGTRGLRARCAGAGSP